MIKLKSLLLLVVLLLNPILSIAQPGPYSPYAERVRSYSSDPSPCNNTRFWFNSTTNSLNYCKSGTVYNYPSGGGVSGSGANTRIAYWNGASSLTSTSGFTFDGSNLSVPTAVITGTTPATTGAIRLANNTYIYTRNQVNTGDQLLIGQNSSGSITIANLWNINPGTGALSAAGSYNVVWNNDTGLIRTAAAKLKLNDGSTGYGSLDLLGLQFSGGTTLNNYTEGTFTPAINFGGGTTGITYATQAGWYTRIGDLVYFTFTIILTNKGSSTGQLNITGLPVSAGSNTNENQAYFPRIANATYTGTAYGIIIYTTPTQINMEINNGGTLGTMTDAHVSNTFSIVMSGVYRVN